MQDYKRIGQFVEGARRERVRRTSRRTIVDDDRALMLTPRRMSELRNPSTPSTESERRACGASSTCRYARKSYGDFTASPPREDRLRHILGVHSRAGGRIITFPGRTVAAIWNLNDLGDNLSTK